MLNVFSQASALAERDLSSSSGVRMYADQNWGKPPMTTSRTKFPSQSKCSISSHNKMTCY